MSPSTVPPFLSLTRPPRTVPLTVPQTVTSCAITVPSTSAPSPISRSAEACTSPLICPNTWAGPLHSMLPTIDMPLPMHETVLASASACGFAAFRSTTGACGGTIVVMIGEAFALAFAVLLSSCLLSSPLRLNMLTPLFLNAVTPRSAGMADPPGHDRPFDCFVACNREFTVIGTGPTAKSCARAVMINSAADPSPASETQGYGPLGAPPPGCTGRHGHDPPPELGCDAGRGPRGAASVAAKTGVLAPRTAKPTWGGALRRRAGMSASGHVSDPRGDPGMSLGRRRAWRGVAARASAC